MTRDCGLQDIQRERRITAVGAVLTQLIMIAVVLAFSATIARHHPGGRARQRRGDVLGTAPVHRRNRGESPPRRRGPRCRPGRGLVASLAGAWGISEVFGWTHTLNELPGRKTAKFYIVYGLAHVVGAVVVLFSLDLINLVVDVEVMNALLLPIVLGLLLALEARALPFEQRMHGWRRTIATGLCLVVIGFGLYTVFATLRHL